MKKFLAILLAAVMALSLVACGGSDAPASTPASSVASEPASVPAESTSTPASEPEKSDEDVVAAAAMDYFASFPEDRHMISVEKLFEKIDAGEEMLIIDIRQPDAYAEGHLKGAVNVPYGPAVADALEMIPDDVPLFVNCYSGQTSSQVVALLNIAGKYATNIQGGFNNGISKQEGYEAYITTEAATLADEDYEVEDEIEDAIAAYFEDATTNEHKSFNFAPDKLVELIAAGDETYNILSIRKAEDYAAGHIEGAMNIPFGKGMQEQFAQIPTDKPVIVYCYSGQTSSQTTAVLRMLGYEAYSLAGGMGKEGGSGWLGANGPVVTE